MKNIGMIVAVEMEAVLDRYGSCLGESEQSGFRVFSYELEGYMLHVVNSGVGEIAAAAATQLLIDRYDPDMIVNFGVVGGLTEEMSESLVCVVDRIFHYDFDLSGIDPVVPGQYPGFDDRYIYPDSRLVEKALSVYPGLKKVVCASGDSFVDGRQAKEALQRRSGGQICEMEAAAIALTCRRAGLPCLLIKAVSDAMDGGGKEYYSQLSACSEICLQVCDGIIKAL